MKQSVIIALLLGTSKSAKIECPTLTCKSPFAELDLNKDGTEKAGWKPDPNLGKNVCFSHDNQQPTKKLVAIGCIYHLSVF
jgi:hypothetical protein